MSTNPTTRISERRRFIAEKVATLQAELDALRGELDELDVAERVLKRFTEPEPKSTQLTFIGNGADDSNQSDGPTLPEMVFILLEEAKLAGRRGLTSSEIVAAVQARWRPKFTGDNVRPTLWRMVKHQRLRKRGKTFFPSTSSAEAETGAVGAPVQH